ncbi:V-type ATP synthase subunit C [Clostridium senegalense]|uniref:V-type ATP synthase subunit C n=1 Tax=Clostridium senegalense TaxID=1465809 RepID=A0A6M0H2F3_9CLOT|nr:V-type ATP synthase subunit C [Clostridium senegalense]NEU04960.1 V-type ATP synthase subunit C [Clostridium senegalense]
MDRMEFTHAVARLRVIETKLLDKMKLERMIESASLEEAIRVLSETQYNESISLLKRVEDYEVALNEELKKLYSLMYEVSPDKLIVDIMNLKYDYHNIKVLEKEKILDKDLSSLLIPVGSIDVEKLKTSIVTGDLKGLEPIMREAIKKAENDYEENKDSQRIDIILDRYLYEDMLKRAKESKFEFIEGYVRRTIDLTNIKIMLRVKAQDKDMKFLEGVLIEGGYIPQSTLIEGLSISFENFIEVVSKYGYDKVLKLVVEDYASTKKYTSIEVHSDNYLMDYIKGAKGVNFGPEPIIAYIMAKETELKVVRIILAGKLNKVESNIIRERLRDIYA